MAKSKTSKHLVNKARATRNVFLLTLLISTIFTMPVFGQSAGNWAAQMGGSDFEIAENIVVDAAGNVYTTGFFMGTADFDPGAGTYSLTSYGDRDVFVSKLDVDGNFLWARQLGGTAREEGFGIKVDASGVYLSGNFQGTADFDPGAGTYSLTSYGDRDVFVSKLDVDGNFLWARQLGGASTDQSLDLAIDEFGNVYTTGFFMGTADFDPGAGTYSLTSNGERDVFISKLDSNGNLLMSPVQLGGPSVDFGFAMTVDDSGNILVTGAFAGTVDFDPGAGQVLLTSAGETDAYVWKLDSSGDFIWARQLGSVGSDGGFAIRTDDSGNVYSAGGFRDAVDFDPSAGQVLLTSAGETDAYVWKLDSSGDFIWASQLGGSSDDGAFGMEIDTANNVYITGNFMGTADFDPGAGTYSLTSFGETDYFVSKLDSAGDFVWARRAGGSAADKGVNIALDSSGAVYSAGYISETTSFTGPGGLPNLTTFGNLDILVWKMTDSLPYTLTIQEVPSSPGPGMDLQINVHNGIPGARYATVISFDPANAGGGFGSGEWFGLHINMGDLLSQIWMGFSGSPPYGGFLDSTGSASWSMPSSPGATGVTFWGTSLYLNPNDDSLAATSGATYTFV